MRRKKPVDSSGDSVNAAAGRGQRNRRRIPLKDKFDALSALWIIASIEREPRIAIADVQYRLNLADDSLLRELVSERGELFALGCETHDLARWRADVKVSRPHPAWLKRREDDGEDVGRVLESVSEGDIVRSVFRQGAGQERSPTELLEWGLRHIEALRTASREERENRRALRIGFWAPAVSAAVAIAAMLLTAYIQHTASDVQLQQAHYETEFTLRQQALVGFTSALLEARECALAGDSAGLAKARLRVPTSAEAIAVFFDAEAGRQLVSEAETFSRACLEICGREAGAGADSQTGTAQLIEQERQLEATAMRETFGEWPARQGRN